MQTTSTTLARDMLNSSMDAHAAGQTASDHLDDAKGNDLLHDQHLARAMRHARSAITMIDAGDYATARKFVSLSEASMKLAHAYDCSEDRDYGKARIVIRRGFLGHLGRSHKIGEKLIAALMPKRQKVSA